MGEPSGSPTSPALGRDVQHRLCFLHLLELVAPDEGQRGDDPEAGDDHPGDEGALEAVDERSGVGRAARERACSS